MYRQALIVSLLYLLPAVCRAEPFTVWESSGDIWARNNATGYQWNLTKDWDAGCSNPDVAGATAVWETSNNVFPSIYGYDLDDRFPADLFPVYISVDKGTPLGPKVGVVDTAGWGDYWCAWQMAGSVWANHIQPPLSSSNAFIALPAYTGWFDVEADQLLYEGGSLTLETPPPPELPEPSTLALLITGAFGVLLLVWRRRRAA
jgi:hypothetical protein